ncbi:MAG: NF038130 family PEP-CTERM protein [Cyanophyceae cyanobacterium]
MAQILKKLLISTSIAAGMGFAISAPASAASLTNASVDNGSSDYILYCLNGGQTTSDGCTDLDTVLGSDAGNIELDGDSETPGGWGDAVSVTGEISGQSITVSSLTAADWLADVDGQELGLTWITDAVTALAAQNPVLGAILGSDASVIAGAASDLWDYLKADSDAFTALFSRMSDPNVSFVEEEGGNINIGLIGHFNAFDIPGYEDLLINGLADALDVPTALVGALLAEVDLSFQASELVKVIYNGETQYKYSFSATDTGVTEASDGVSHSGEYIVTLEGAGIEPPAKTPEPSLMLGLAGLAGLYASKRKLQK